MEEGRERERQKRLHTRCLIRLFSSPSFLSNEILCECKRMVRGNHGK
jgi:hypothetical protein